MFSTKPMRQVTTVNNISDKYKFEWIAPERTGSRQLAEVLSYYGFKRGEKSVFTNGSFNYSHISPRDEYYSDYKLLCSARNPYGRVYSIFKNFYQRISDKSIVGFRQFLTHDLPSGQTLQMVLNPNPSLVYDYVIRLEHLVDDLLQLPFISDVLTETQLRMICEHGKEIDNWELFYDNDMKEIVYNLTEYQFKAWGYNK
jgi:hypothetical protein